MAGLQHLRNLHFLTRVSPLCAQTIFISSKSNLYGNSGHQISLFVRFSRAERPVHFKIGENLGDLVKKYPNLKREVQATFLEYLHCTRNLKFEDAEYMTKNAPEFFDRLLQRVEIDEGGDAGRSLARFLRYHPVNEFEPFFESMGLNSSEYASFLPRNLMFLDHDQFLLQIYHALCDYGFSRNVIGRIYKEARVIFRHGSAVLRSKLKLFESLGLEQSLVVKIIASSPYLLIRDSSKEFIQFLEELKRIGIEYDWLNEHIPAGVSPNWKSMLRLIQSFHKLGLGEENLKQTIARRPGLLVEGYVRIPFCLFAFLLKFGCTHRDIQNVFLQFPDISVAKFYKNLRRSYKFLAEIRLPIEDIGRMFRLYPRLLGSCKVKEYHTMRCLLNCGRLTLREMVKDDPHVLEKWVVGAKVEKPPEMKRNSEVKLMRTEFLLSLGFVENSKEMERAVRRIWGRVASLKERFECLVHAGLIRDDVITMLKVCPDIINQSKESLEMKISCFVEDLGYPLHVLARHPHILTFTVVRMKLRYLMYKWLKDEGTLIPKLGLSYLISCPEENFVRRFVSCHSGGLEFWERLKNQLYSA